MLEYYANWESSCEPVFWFNNGHSWWRLKMSSFQNLSTHAALYRSTVLHCQDCVLTVVVLIKTCWTPSEPNKFTSEQRLCSWHVAGLHVLSQSLVLECSPKHRARVFFLNAVHRGWHFAPSLKQSELVIEIQISIYNPVLCVFPLTLRSFSSLWSHTVGFSAPLEIIFHVKPWWRHTDRLVA